MDEFDPISSGKGTFSGLAKRYLDEGNKLLGEAGVIKNRVAKLDEVRKKQKGFELDKIGVTNGDSYPQGQILTITIGGATHTGYFAGDEFFVTDRRHPAAEKYSGFEFENPATRTGNPVIVRDDFFFADAGTPVHVGTGIEISGTNPGFNPVRYVVAAGLRVTVLVVYAWQVDENGARFLNVVPTQYYQVLQLNFDSLPVTTLSLPQPLSSLTDSEGFTLGFEDELWCTVVSEVGPNTVDIMRFIITKYTNYSIDETSFGIVRNQLAPFPMNFALMNRPTAISLLQDLAYQARCIIYAKNEVFYLKYLSVKDTPITTINESDIIYQSLEVTTTETEDLVTKYIAEWSPDQLYTVLGNLTVGDAKYLVILRFNTTPYGIHEQRVNYFAYNQQILVEKSATFWLIRLANIYKKIKCKVPLTKLNLEIMDSVTLNFSHPYIANSPVIGLIEEATFNPDDYTVSLIIWTPVRLGETQEYNFAYPGNLTEFDFWPTIDDTLSGRAKNSHVSLPEEEKPFSGDKGNGGSITYADKPKTWGDITPADHNFQTPELLTRVDSTAIKPLGQKPPGTSNYQYVQEQVKLTPIQTPAGTASFPAKITGGSGEFYSVEAYPDGLTNPSSIIDDVKQLQIDPSETIPIDTWCIVTRIIVTNAKGQSTISHQMQVPVWL